jgi:hypothetical protein
LTAAALAVALTAHVPVLVHDSRERFPLTSVAAAPIRVPGLDTDRRPAVYGRVARAKNAGAWLQYWLFYRAQDQDRGIVRTGRHAGDWEMVQYRLDAHGHPVEAVYAQHSGAERAPWQTVQRRSGHPVVYVARGSHASYLRHGVRDRTWPDPNDEADGHGRVVQPRLVRITATNPRWMRWPGRWGGARARWWVPGEQDSPFGPAFQRQGRWSDPDGWARAARSGRAGCDHLGECDWRETLLGTSVVAALAGALSLRSIRHRRRRLRPPRPQQEA